MTSGGIPDEVHDFVLAHIHSVEQLEVLLLLRSDTSRAWTASEVARELRIAELSTRNRLADLVSRRLVEADGDGRHRYAPAAAADGAAVDALAQAYAERRVTVIQLIFSRPSDAARSFADAFKLRKE